MKKGRFLISISLLFSFFLVGCAPKVIGSSSTGASVSSNSQNDSISSLSIEEQTSSILADISSTSSIIESNLSSNSFESSNSVSSNVYESSETSSLSSDVQLPSSDINPVANSPRAIVVVLDISNSMFMYDVPGKTLSSKPGDALGLPGTRIDVARKGLIFALKEGIGDDDYLGLVVFGKK